MKIFHYNKTITHKQTVRSILFRSWELPRSSRNSSHFMKPRSFVLKRGSPPSLSWIRSVHAPNYLLEGSVLKLPSHLHLGILSVVFPSSTPTEPLTSPYVSHSTLISFYLILSPENCLLRGANRQSTLRNFIHSPVTTSIQVQNIFSTLYFRILSTYVVRTMWETMYHTNTKQKVDIVLYISIFIFMDSKL